MRRAAVGPVLVLLVGCGNAGGGGAGAETDPGEAEGPGETLDAFQARVEAAFEAADREAALGDLIHTEGMDDWESALAGRTADRLAAMDPLDSVSLEPLPEGFDPVNVLDGAELRPYPDPKGLVVLHGRNRSHIPYGEAGGRRWIVGTRRTVIDPDAPPDDVLQIMVVGVASPPAEFRGWCDVRYSTGDVERLELDDQGVGNQTRVVRGREIEACEVSNTGGRGTLALRLQVGEDVVFEARAESPDTVLAYPVPASN